MTAGGIKWESQEIRHQTQSKVKGQWKEFCPSPLECLEEITGIPMDFLVAKPHEMLLVFLQPVICSDFLEALTCSISSISLCLRLDENLDTVSLPSGFLAFLEISIQPVFKIG